jgi:hypothetical protein
VCVELKLHFLLLDALLQAPQLAEAEGTDLEAARGGRTLAALRALLACWAADASERYARLTPASSIYAWLLMVQVPSLPCAGAALAATRRGIAPRVRGSTLLPVT